MARIVVPSREVYHLFAAQSQPEARNSSRSVWFRDTAAYSYAAEIGRIHTHPVTGARVVLLADRTWSVTTSKHQSFLRSAVSHLPTLRVKYTNPIGRERAANVTDYLERITDAQGKAKRARVAKEWWEREVAGLQAECLAYCAFFDVTPPATFDAASLAAIRAEQERVYRVERAAREAVEAKRVAAHDRKQAKNLAKWRRGEAVEYRGSVTALRVPPPPPPCPGCSGPRGSRNVARRPCAARRCAPTLCGLGGGEGIRRHEGGRVHRARGYRRHAPDRLPFPDAERDYPLCRVARLGRLMPKPTLCPNCSQPITRHCDTGCALGMIEQVIRERGDTSERRLRWLVVNCNASALWDDIAGIVDRVEDGEYSAEEKWATEGSAD